jgi:hypothetical protein
MTGTPPPRYSHLRLMPPEPRPRRRLSARINVLDGRSPFGRSRGFRLHERDLAELVAQAERLERRQ